MKEQNEGGEGVRDRIGVGVIGDAIRVIPALEHSFREMNQPHELVRMHSVEEALSCEWPQVYLLEAASPDAAAGRGIRQLARNVSEVPIVVLSTDHATGLEVMEAGANDYLIQPWPCKDLAEMIVKAALRGREMKASKWLKDFHVNILKNVQDAIIVTNPEGAITYWNAGSEQIFGFKAAEMIGRSVGVLYPGASRMMLERDLARIQAGDDVSMEWKLTRMDNSEVWVDLKASGMRGDRGSVAGFIAVGKDITARKHADTERRSLEEQLRQAQKLESLGNLAGGIVHDFNNILGIILGHATLLERGHDDPAKLVKSLDAVNNAVQRGAQLTRQILTFARRSGTNYEPISINATVGELVTMLQGTFPKTIVFSLDLDPDLPVINADAGQIHQVLLNLAVNARDAMPDGGTIEIRSRTIDGRSLLERYPDAGHGAYICLSLADTGVGMNDEVRARIFEPFFTTKDQGKGTGLGLSVVYGVVRGHGGYIELESEPGRGTTFYVCIPVTSPAVEPGYGTPVPAITVSGNETILLVEDEGMLMELVRSLLEGHGYTVLVASDGVEAVEVFRKNRDVISLVMSDVGLPRLTGVEALRQMREIDPEVVAILASGYLDSETKSDVLKSGTVKHFLQKPYVPDIVLQTIREVLDLARVNHRE